jgi:hypothetical protein
MKYAAISLATQHLQGCVIAFVGDHTMTRELTPVLLPIQKMRQWAKEKVCVDGPAMIKYYRDDSLCQCSLWKPMGDKPFKEAHAPRLLAIPLILVAKRRKPAHALQGTQTSGHEDLGASGTRGSNTRRCMKPNRTMVLPGNSSQQG